MLMNNDFNNIYNDSQQRAKWVYARLHDELNNAKTIYVGGTGAVGEARFLCKLFANVIFVDDYKAGSQLFERPVISTGKFAKQVTREDFLINNCSGIQGFNHFYRQSLSLNIPYCNVVEALATFYSKGMVMKFAGLNAVYGPAFHQHTYENIDRYAALRQRFTDPLSLKTFDNLINYRLTGNPYLLSSTAVGHNWGTIGHDSYVLNAQFFTLTENEVFIDAGALDGKTSEYFLNSVNGKFDRIVMFEPATESAKKCQLMVDKLDKEFPESDIARKINIVESGLYNRTGMLPLALSLFDTDLTNLHGELPQSAHIIETGLSKAFVEPGEEYKVINVPITTLDNYLGKDPATFIKFEIEGSEVAALEGATETILRNKPKMALSIYHRPQDLELMMDYVKDLSLDYKIALRAHNPNTPDAIVMYCWI